LGDGEEKRRSGDGIEEGSGSDYEESSEEDGHVGGAEADPKPAPEAEGAPATVIVAAPAPNAEGAGSPALTLEQKAKVEWELRNSPAELAKRAEARLVWERENSPEGLVVRADKFLLEKIASVEKWTLLEERRERGSDEHDDAVRELAFETKELGRARAWVARLPRT
jgi:hypothetical protein